MTANIPIVKNLSGVLDNAQWEFAAGKIAVDLDRSNSKNIRGLMLSSEGITAYKGKIFLCIPKAELWKLIEEINPEFKATVAPSPAVKK